jgi:hypothetical protein
VINLVSYIVPSLLFFGFSIFIWLDRQNRRDKILLEAEHQALIEGSISD